MKKAADVASYLAAQPEGHRKRLQELRAIIQKVAPDATEGISYGMPMFKYYGMLAGYAGATNHIGFYPGAIVGEFAAELKNYSTDKGTIRFEIDQPLPATLIKKIVKRRMQLNIEKEQMKTLKKVKAKKAIKRGES